MRKPPRRQRPAVVPARSGRRSRRALGSLGLAALLVLAIAPAASATPREKPAHHSRPHAAETLPSSWFPAYPFRGSIDLGDVARIAAASADLSVTVTDAPDPVATGSPITYTIDVANAGPDPALATVLAFTLASGTTYTSATPSVGTCMEAAGVVTCQLGDLASGTSASVSVVVGTTVAGTAGPATATVTSSVPDPDLPDTTATTSTAVTDPADLAATIDDGVTTFTPGTTLTYTMGLANAGPSDAAAGVMVVGHAPAGTTPHTTDPACVVAGTDVTCTTTAPLAASASTSWAFTLDVPLSFVGSTLDTQASITSSPTADANAANNTATDSDAVVAQADLSIAVAADPHPAVAGEDLTYAITVTNAGPTTVNDAVVTDTVPAGTTFKKVLDGGTQTGGVATWTLGALAAGDTATVHLVVTVNANRSTDLTNDVSVASAVADPDSTDRSATVVTKVTEGGADLSVATTSGGGSVSPGDVVRFVVTVSNHGPADATGIKIKDHLPNGVTIRSADASHGSFSKSSGIWDLGALANGHHATLHITATVNATAGSSLVNSASVQAVDQSDPKRSNDDDRTTVKVLGADVSNTHTTTSTTTTTTSSTVSGTDTLATTGTDASAHGAVTALLLLALGLALVVVGHRLERPSATDR